MSAITVVKLGGSFAFSEDLPAWLAAIERSVGKTVLVVGGGPFADAIRSAQPRMGFDDVAADSMALLAMEQYAIAVAALRQKFEVAASNASIKRALEGGKMPVWAPSLMVQNARRLAASSSSRERVDIASSWDVTSDSLAVWLARKLRARRLLLIKQVSTEACNSADRAVTAEQLALTGVVDKAFPRCLAAASGVKAFLLGPRDLEALAIALRKDLPIGYRIDLVARTQPIHHATSSDQALDGRVLPGDEHV